MIFWYKGLTQVSVDYNDLTVLENNFHRSYRKTVNFTALVHEKQLCCMDGAQFDIHKAKQKRKGKTNMIWASL